MEQNRELCVTCCRSVRQDRSRHVLTQDELEARLGLADYVLHHINTNQAIANNEQFMCYRCLVAARRHEERFNQQQAQANVAEPEDPAGAISIRRVEEFIVVPDYKRLSNTANRCMFRDCTNGDIIRIPKHITVTLLINMKIYTPSSARVCHAHLRSNIWADLSSDFSIFRTVETFSADQIRDMLETQRNAYLKKKELDFEYVENINVDELHFCTGVTLEQFNTILLETPSLQERSNRPNTALGVYLMKVRTGEPNDRLASRLSMSRRTLERLINIARECLSSQFVPRHLGINHISRDEIIAHSLQIPNDIYNDHEQSKAILVMDGTYIYIQKSSKFLFQKETYSLHKFRNLLKPFLIVCPDGYILDVFGPYAAKTSDATILSRNLNEEDAPLHYLLQEGDVFILDRGFRDALSQIESCGYEAHMLPTKDRNATQLSTEQANKSRLVTIVRWVVEVINGRIKRDFKIFRQEFFNRAMTHMFTDIRIAAALINAFRDPLVDIAQASEIIQIINQRINVANCLGDYVTENNLNRQRAQFLRINSESLNISFPILSEEDLILIALGTYQIKLARSYVGEHIRNGIYNIEVCQEISPNLAAHGVNTTNCVLLRGQIHSRHVSRKTYYSYILVKTNLTGRNALPHLYCSCLTGSRTIGTCAHIMSILWYLGFARHQDGFQSPASFLDSVIVDQDQ